MKTVALIGNPNTGKSTLFNALTGLSQRTGNFAGVTVEKKIGTLTLDHQTVQLIDLPGTYSLTATSPDEIIATEVILGKRQDTPRPDVVVVVVDASNLERNLYLATQLLESPCPIIVALNMMDLAATKQLNICMEKLKQALGCEVVGITANKRRGLDELKKVIENTLNAPFVMPAAALIQITKDEKINSTILEAEVRYQRITEIVKNCVQRKTTHTTSTFSDAADRILTHPIAGMLVFLGLMAIVFQSIYTWAGPFMDWIDGGFGWLSDEVASVMPPGALQSLVTDGIIAGVGAVMVFLPQIVILFGFIAILEDCGYMARAAFLMDRLMSWVGLSGRSFVPMLSSFACAVPGVMATRVIENKRDRYTTMLVAPLMSCSARLPVYTIMIAAFIPNTAFLQGFVLLAMYLIGIVVAVPVAWILKKTLLKGETPPFVMEMPAYKIPDLRTVLMRMVERGRAFLERAGTVIFAVVIVIWGLAYFPHPDSIKQRYPEEKQQNGEYLRQSILGRAGQFIEPVIKPLGWDWKIGMATIASFPAREVIIATLGTIYNLGDAEDETSSSLRDTMRAEKWPDGRPVYTPLVAISIMVFFALCCQCAATLSVIKRETNSWRWPIFTFVYMTGLAYVASLLVYQVGSLL